ncbi:MAG: hypothetical protein LH616_08580 [Ilumatobacteraceae bacterium]|nr:hypothetical protein [Ilumatobacteraceae bacterium]
MLSKFWPSLSGSTWVETGMGMGVATLLSKEVVSRNFPQPGVGTILEGLVFSPPSNVKARGARGKPKTERGLK